MTNYIIHKQALKEILLGHKAFISIRCKELTNKGIDITKLTYRETEKLTDEYIEIIISAIPIESIEGSSKITNSQELKW